MKKNKSSEPRPSTIHRVLVALIGLQMALGPAVLLAEDVKSPVREGSLVDELRRQIQPEQPDKALEAARSTIAEERAKNAQSRRKRQGTAPTGPIQNEAPEPLRSHFSFLYDMASQSRYRSPALIELGLEAAGVLGYWLYVRKMRRFWTPRFNGLKKLKDGIAEPSKALAAAEDGYAQAIVKNWKAMAEDNRALLKESWDPVFRDRVLGELSKLESGTLTTAEKEVLERSGKIEKAFAAMADAARDWTRAVRLHMTDAEAAINAGFAAQGPAGAAQAFNMQALFKSELKSLEELDAVLNRPGVLSYYLHSSKLLKQWIPRLKSAFVASASVVDAGKNMQAAAQEVSAAIEEFSTAQRGLFYSLVKHWNNLPVEQSGYSNSLDLTFVEKNLLELQTKASSTTLTAAEQAKITSAATIEEAVKGFDSATERLHKVVSRFVPGSVDLARDQLGDVAQGVVRSKRGVLREANQLRTMAKQMATLKPAQQAAIRGAITAMENPLEAASKEAALNSRVKGPPRLGWGILGRPRVAKPPFFSFRRLGPKLGFAALVALPIAVYAIDRAADLEEETQYQLYLKRAMLKQPEDTLGSMLSLGGLRFQYGAFQRAWEQHPQLGGANIQALLPPLGSPDGLDPALVTVFLPLMSAAAVDLQAEIDSYNHGVPKAIADLSYDARLYRKVWTYLFIEARNSENPNQRVKLMRWPNEPKPSSPILAVPGDVPHKPMEEKALDVDDLIADLAYLVIQMPQETVSEGVSEEDLSSDEEPAMESEESAEEAELE